MFGFDADSMQCTDATWRDCRQRVMTSSQPP